LGQPQRNPPLPQTPAELFKNRVISHHRGDDGKITVLAEYRTTELPSPGHDAGLKIFETFREMTHIDTDKGKTALALGIRDSSIELNVKIRMKDGTEKISIGFPKR
jgi:hypothetical protein